MIRQHLEEVLRPLQQAVVDMQGVPGAQLQIQLQHDGLGVLGVQQPPTPELCQGASVGPEEIWRGKGAVEVSQTFPTGGVGTAQLIGPVRAVWGSVTTKGRREAAGGLGLGTRNRTKGAESRLSLCRRRGATTFVGGVSAFVLTVALPGARKTLSIPTQELIRLTAALTKVTYEETTHTEFTLQITHITKTRWIMGHCTNTH